MRLRGVWLCGLGMALAVTVACGGGGQETAKEAATPAAAAGQSSTGVDAAVAAEVKGHVSIEGTVPANAEIKMNADPVCARQVTGAQSMET